MNIALLSAEYPPLPGGVGDYTHRLALALHQRQQTVSVITGQIVPGAGAPVTPPAVRTVAAWNWRCWRDVIAALDHLRPDVLHIQYQTGAYAMHPAINLLPRRLRALPRHPRLVVTFHDLLEPYLFPKAGHLRRQVTLLLARSTDAVVVTNAADAANLQAARGVARDVLHTIPIGSNIPVAPPTGYTRERWRADLGIAPDTLLVGYFGLLSRSKGVDLLLDALLQLDTDMPLPWHLLLIGGSATAPQDRAYAAEIIDRIAQPALRERVLLTGHVDPATVSAHLLVCDIMALPLRGGASYRSGSLLAALSHGAAVVTTRPPAAAQQPVLDGLPHLVESQSALLVPPDSSTALAAGLRHLADDADLRRTLGERARALAGAFDWTTIAERHEQIYTTLLNRSER